MELRNQVTQHSTSAKRALNTTAADYQKRREDSIHEDTIFNPSPDDQTPIQRPGPDQDPNRPTTWTDPTINYRECQKNHAAHMGTHIVDGCGEFLPEHNAAMVCAACGCHRNFHRKETRHQSIQIRFDRRPSVVYRPFPFRQTAPANDDVEAERSSEKRFRTKFTGEEKEKMRELGEKIGWRIRKEEEGEVQRFCESTGVERRVFKVWMHNYKQAMKRKLLDQVHSGFGQDPGRT